MKKHRLNLVLALALAALCLWAVWQLVLRPAAPGQTATVRQENQVLLTIPLEEEQEYSLRPWGIDMTIEVSRSRARVSHSNCPDHICVDTGWLELSGQTAVCMPNRVTLTLD